MMKSKPVITVQLIHIQGTGPLNGNEQEFTDSTILLGRNKDCNLRYPPDLAVVSRLHAEITRVGNQFKLSDRSANGTFVNGKRITETYLKEGDIIELSQGGPKLSFLTEIKEDAGLSDITQELRPEDATIIDSASSDMQSIHASSADKGKQDSDSEIPISKIKAPFTIQYGPTLRSFDELPISLGKNPKCDFIIDHPSVSNLHAQIIFYQDNYWIKDFSNATEVNDRPIGSPVCLNADDEISLGTRGPRFRFIAGGRLADISGPDVTSQENSAAGKDESQKEIPKNSGVSDKLLSRFKKYLKS
jgi:pSer/pThr/pTyr-binding forkhead associated (FHA) protein